MKSSQFYNVICVAIRLTFFLKKWWPSTWLHLWLPNPPCCFHLPHHIESLHSHLPSGVNESLWNYHPLCLSKVAIACTLLFQFSVHILLPPWTIPTLVVSLLSFIFEPRAFTTSVAFNFVFNFKTIPKGALSRYCFKGSLARCQFVKRVIITGWKKSWEWPISMAGATGGAGFFAIAFDFGFDSNPLQYCFNGSLVSGQLVKRVVIAGWKTQDSFQQTQPHCHCWGSTHAYNLNKRFIWRFIQSVMSQFIDMRWQIFRKMNSFSAAQYLLMVASL